MLRPRPDETSAVPPGSTPSFGPRRLRGGLIPHYGGAGCVCQLWDVPAEDALPGPARLCSPEVAVLPGSPPSLLLPRCELIPIS